MAALCAEAGLTSSPPMRASTASRSIGRRATRSTSANAATAAPELVERERARDRDVERLGSVGQRDARNGIERCGDLRRQAGALAAQREGDGGAGLNSASVCSPRASSAIIGSGGASRSVITGTAVERPHARSHCARRERVGAALGQRHVRGAEALRAAQQRAEVAGVGDAVELQPDAARRRSRRRAAGGRWRARPRRRGSCGRATRAPP